jgi:hypothetical protein
LKPAPDTEKPAEAGCRPWATRFNAFRVAAAEFIRRLNGGAVTGTDAFWALAADSSGGSMAAR